LVYLEHTVSRTWLTQWGGYSTCYLWREEQHGPEKLKDPHLNFSLNSTLRTCGKNHSCCRSQLAITAIFWWSPAEETCSKSVSLLQCLICLRNDTNCQYFSPVR
jgi:hypothetical protein